MHGNRFLKGIKIVLFVVLMSIALGFIVKSLWEYLDSAHLRLAQHHLLAGSRPSCPQQDSLWSFHRHGPWRRQSMETAHEESLGEYDPPKSARSSAAECAAVPSAHA